MKRLFIIGNGFDLAHGLPTKYLDYRIFLKNSPENDDFCMRIERTYGLDETADYWWRDFEANLGEGYVFECEFESMAETAIEEMVTDDGEEMYDIEQTLRYHFEPYYDFMRKLNETVLQWVKSVDISGIKPVFERINGEDNYFLTFNYTNVLEDIYDISPNKVFHIHGSAAERSVIMGHGNMSTIKKYQKEADERNEKLDKNGDEISRGIYNFYMASLKDTSRIIKLHEHIFKKYDKVKEVHVFGHSLGIVDIPYFLKIKQCVQRTADWYFYIYCDKGELPEKKNELYKKIERLKIGNKRIHVLPSTMF